VKTYGYPQRSDEWFAIRCGIPTASSADKILTPGGDLSTQSEAYLNRLLADRAGYGDAPMEPTEWMLRGIELEPEARALFEFETGHQIEQVGFITNDEGTAGCSPDGLVGSVADSDGLVSGMKKIIASFDIISYGFEVKCPKASTHFGYLRAGTMPPFYKPQVHFSMAVTGITAWYFMSYFPGLDPLIVLVEADEYTDKVSAAIAEFSARLEKESARFGLEKKQ
jgi:hypothetical protein